MNDLTGKIFGKLTVIKRYGHKGKYITWLCKCSCGNENVIVKGELLTSRHTKSCGCIKRSNVFIFKPYFVIGVTKKNERFYFNIEEFEKVSRHTWYKSMEGYIETTTNDNRFISLHRLVMDAEEGEVVDHKNHGSYDNRKRNLRKCSISQNQMNKKIQINNTSGVTGISWFPTRNTWVVRIGVNKKRIIIGYFKNFDDAIQARKQAEEKYFGEYAYKNNNDVRLR